MMTFHNLVNYVGAIPFRPFRIKMVSGKTLDIRHPEMIQIGVTTAIVYTWMDMEIEEPKERQKEISVVLIESIEHLEARTPHERTAN